MKCLATFVTCIIVVHAWSPSATAGPAEKILKELAGTGVELKRAQYWLDGGSFRLTFERADEAPIHVIFRTAFTDSLRRETSISVWPERKFS